MSGTFLLITDGSAGTSAEIVPDDNQRDRAWWGAFEHALACSAYDARVYRCTPDEDRMRDITEDMAHDWRSDRWTIYERVPSQFEDYLRLPTEDDLEHRLYGQRRTA